MVCCSDVVETNGIIIRKTEADTSETLIIEHVMFDLGKLGVAQPYATNISEKGVVMDSVV